MTDDRALRESISQRLTNLAHDQQVAPDRIRRHFVFQRILARLGAAEGWVLKGGFAIEVRLGLQARATKDLDLALQDDVDASDLQERLLDVLEADAGDSLVFDVSTPRPIAPDPTGNPGWKFTVTANLGGKEFAKLRLDVVSRADEIAGGVSTIELDAPILADRLSRAVISAVDVAQHAAEKFHAMARTYAGDRPSSRVKDLVDVALFFEAGLLPHPDLGHRLTTVWQVRDDSPPPSELPEFPASWADDFAAMAAELDLTVDYTGARSIAVHLYTEATTHEESHP